MSVDTVPTCTHPPYFIQQEPFVNYPDSDGQPMAENDPQYFCITDTRFALGQFLKDHEAYVGADLLVYYRRGDPSKSVAPDVLVTFGVPKGHRRSFKIWEEGKAPDVVFEFASESSWQDDLDWKRGLYLGIGVREYFLFDPNGEYFDPVLQGYQLAAGSFERLPALPASGRGVLGLYSKLLGLELWARPNDDPEMPYVLRLYDLARGQWLQTPDEAAARAEEAAARAEAEAAARQAAEAEIARLKAELARLRGEEG